MKFNIDDYKGRYVMWCKTEEEARDFCRYLDSVGRRWVDGDRYTEIIRYEDYGKRTCYNFNHGFVGGLPCYADLGFTILEWSDFMNKGFTKADLKGGDVVKRRNGRVEIVCLEVGALISRSACGYLLNLKNDLTDGYYGSEFDVVAVKRPEFFCDYRYDAFDKIPGKLVYERKETEDAEEMTLEEVCKALGKEIKIVKNR